MRLILTFTFLAGISFSADSRDCESIRCATPKCGCEYLKEGWKEVGRCDGHWWRYLLQKGKQLKLCEGVSARGGPSEFPCVDFSGDVAKFQKCDVTGPTGEIPAPKLKGQ